ncbi:Formate-dependent nitrite reductase complex subunit NrfG [Caballeronia hypogeia]|uniref:Formate-dependent nitrite reductase complex subunit NrfG n=1 Tax=Caballeronia hypogeia TaxID=1777140 RepID=A0A158CGI3_9BURK|nr:tetratricopeptide repeat protein [Caballeronia hypogeia]SAK81454.1 Formate-dependent nitrite reductase complex subunit NrfG [Caballeronia hypogeia]
MITFWLLAAAMMLAAIACVVPPLLRAASPERPRNFVAPHAALAGLLIALVPGAALTLYMRIGDPAALAIQTASFAPTAEHADAPASMDAAISRLAARLRENPNDAQGWAMLARSYMALDRPLDAAEAYRRAVALTPRNAELLADYADASASANGGDLDDSISKIIDSALALDAEQPKALALAASAAFDRRDYPRAIQFWERLSRVPDLEPEIAQQARKNIDETRVLAAKGSLAQSAAVEVRVDLSPELAKRVRAADTVFVYALPDDGSRMPLAVQRLRADQLPATVRLDDSMSMTPGRRLSDFSRISIDARVSMSGQARPAAGDLTGSSGLVPARGAGVVGVTIAEVVR